MGMTYTCARGLGFGISVAALLLTAASLVACGGSEDFGDDAGAAGVDASSGGGSGSGAGGNGGTAGSGGSAGSGGAAGTGGAAGSAGADAGSAAPPVAGSPESHFPLVDGASFTYRHDKHPTKAAWDEVATLTATTHAGKPAFILEDQEDAQGELSRTTLVVDGTRIYRVKKEVSINGAKALEVTYDPGFLRFDEAWTEVGTMVTSMSARTETCIMSSAASNCVPGSVVNDTSTHIFRVLATDVEVTVPAGTFTTVQFERINSKNGETKHFWFAPGIGKILEKDTTTGATEELLTYTLP